MIRRIDNPDTEADVKLRKYLGAGDRRSFVMVAGAGSGKTTSLIKALDYVCKTQGKELRTRNQRIACITYTEVAVEEIGTDVHNNPLVHVSTIHSFLWALVNSFQKDIAVWVRQRIETKLMELNQTRANFGPRVQGKTRDKNARDTAKLEAHLAAIGSVTKFTYESGSNYSAGILGHDDIIKMGSHLIKKHPLLTAILAQRYPYFFIDESQDTFPEVVEALKGVSQLRPGTFCLGFFGDPMQKIYMSGVGDIPVDAGWALITKPENFRCPEAVLAVINRLRRKGDGIQQTRGRQYLNEGGLHQVPGTAKAFILPTDVHRAENLAKVRAWLAASYADPHWVSDEKEGDVRILVLVHRMAATRLKFAELYAAFKDHGSDSLSTSFHEGNAWPIKPFLDVLLPLVLAWLENRPFDVIEVLRSHCPQFEKGNLKLRANVSELLSGLKDNVRNLVALMDDTGDASILDVLRFACDAQLINVDERIKQYLAPPSPGEVKSIEGVKIVEDEEDISAAIAAFLACPAKQVWGYQKYLDDESPYSTQQGIKGAEFERVLVVIDDEEGPHFQFSYDKLLGLKAPSQTDIDNKEQGKETILDRTRRLFYVCCSRAKKDLAVVVYSANVERAAILLRGGDLFAVADIHTLADIA